MTNATTASKEESLKVATMAGDKIVDGDAAGSIPVVLVSKSGRRIFVAESETVSPEVKWQPHHRKYHDKVFGILYLLAMVSFFITGGVLLANAHPRYDWVEVINNGDKNNNTGVPATVRVISSHFRADVETCCANKLSSDEYSFDLCSELNAETALRRRLSQTIRALPESSTDDDYPKDDDLWEDNAVRTSKYEFGDGMFDAFLEAPEIPIAVALLGMTMAIVWAVLLRFFSIPIVYATEVVKVALFLYLSVRVLVEGLVGAAVVAFFCAMTIVAWDIYTFKKLKFAGKVLRRAAKSLKRNATMFFAFLPILFLYAGQAYLFVLFFARSFEVVAVKHNQICRTLTSGAQSCQSSCEYESPAYTTPIVAYLSLCYLWSIGLFHMMRLSIIAAVIGSSHFHPGDKEPGLMRAIINTCTTSMGSLSVASLISAIADKLNRMLLTETLWTQCCNPVFWVILPIYCVFGVCLRTLIAMLTKFSVILHVFTGKSWMGSARKVSKILKRHFKGGFVTEYASRSVLTLGSYVFSIVLYFVAWVWLDAEFKTDTFIGVNEETLMVVGWLFFALFNIWYPVLGLYVLILTNSWLSKWDGLDPAYWVSPMAATFIACLGMMFFSYLGGVFLDTVDVLFLCFAIDKDNCVDVSSDEFAALVAEGVPTFIETPEESLHNADEENPIQVAKIEPIPPPGQ
ncbi:Plasma-membrane choline transporter [Seminavis robusta]|uniref:Choline transporter-like protein n=1 Tax=Seminavis robusta TaxID=568900 RepID=A0A9N8EDT6_9STRA|nr:Plasma-membrane choline transporter [Seminavis robusta]|eukprot:Sro931_g221470.1 Plasma-membrane choline transporter (686) ;mRNA; f:26896-28953